MLTALDTCGQQVVSTAAARGQPYFCRECRGELIFKRGTIVVPHFAHRPGSLCSFGKGESLRHQQMKAQIGALLSRWDVRYEVDLVPGRRADVVVGTTLVVECQDSPLLIEEWNARTADYNQAGLRVLWVWDLGRLGMKGARGKTFAWFDRAVEDDPEVRVPVEVRHCHRHSYGRIYVLDGSGELRACHLDSAYYRDSDGGPDGEWTGYTPRTLKCPRFQAVPLKPTRLRGTDGELLATLGEGVWWKKRAANE